MNACYKKTLNKIKAAIKKHNLINKNDCVLIALSGGGDSVFLLHALDSLKDYFKFSLACAHLNHSLREEADDEAIFCKKLCEKYGIDFYEKKADVEQFAKEHGISCETAGRQIRYLFFEELKNTHGFTKIATAHHADDNAETILMHFIRGSGAKGLCGIEYSRPDGIIRPLLDITKDEISCCLDEENLEFATDKTNFETIYTRNRVRLELIPEILKYNPNFCEVITKNAALFTEDEEFLDSFAQNIFDENFKDNSIDFEILSAQPFSIRRRIVQKLYQKFTFCEQNLSQRYIEAILSLSRSGQTISLPGKINARLEYGILKLEMQTTADSYEYTIIPDIPLEIPQSGMTVVLKKANSAGKNVFFLPDNAICTVRNRRSKDFFFPIGMTGRKTVSNLFTDKKIPTVERWKIPILTADGEIVNIGGKHHDRRFYQAQSTKNLFTFEIIKKE